MSASTSPSDVITVQGVTLECRWFGADQGDPPIVMLHEGLGAVAMWKDFPRRLAERTGRRVFCYSRQGYGQSDPWPGPRQPDYMHREAQIVLPAVLDAAGLDRPILFGHSDGASIALIHAATSPRGVSGLVLEAPHVFVEPLTVRSIAAAKTAYVHADLRQKLGRYHKDVDGAFRGWNDIWLDARFLDWNIESALPHIRQPILLIQGLDDEYGTRAQLDSIASHTGRADIQLLEACGHSPHRDQPEAVLAATARFVRTLTGAQPA